MRSSAHVPIAPFATRLFATGTGLFATGLCASALFFMGCGSSISSAASDAGPADAPSELRMPVKHRPTAEACPPTRGPGANGLGSCAPSANVECVADSDCTTGTNGRCLATSASITCFSACSYDTCTNDGECPDNQACACRASTFDATPNSCVAGGNCRLDSDCGAGVGCSPSQVNRSCVCPSPALCGSSAMCTACKADGTCMSVPCACGDACGHAFFCHTPQDTCVDDSDCTGQETCNYDVTSNHWTCVQCAPPP